MNLQTLITSASRLLSELIPLMVGLALIIFLFGLAKSVFGGASERGREAGKNLAIWGIVALFVMVSVWGLVHFIQANLNITNLAL